MSDQPDPTSEAEAQSSSTTGLLNLTRQQRNLLLLRPLFQLELNKTRIGDDTPAEKGLFQGIDTHYLTLFALDLMMEGTTLAMGCTPEEVLAPLAEAARQMKPSVGAVQCQKVAEVILETLDNKANNSKEFSLELFDAPAGLMRNHRFRLVVYEPDLEDVYRYRPTQEGYLVYLGMLDLSPEDSQVLMEKMLDLLVSRGRYDMALEIARRARKLSIEYRQLIHDRLNQAYRSPGTVNWSRDMSGKLDAARDHVRQRQQEDQRMEESVREALLVADEPRSRDSLAQLLTTIRGSTLLRSKLVIDISAAPERFLESQRSLFRARRPSGLPDLETRLLPQLLGLPANVLAENADHLLSGLYPATWPMIYDLNSLFSLMLELRPDELEPEVDDGVLTPHVVPAEEFPEELQAEVRGWLENKFLSQDSLSGEQLLVMAEDEGLGWSTQRCLVFTLFGAYPESESRFPSRRAEAQGRFKRPAAQGTNLLFTPVTGS